MSRFDAWHRATKRGYNDGINWLIVIFPTLILILFLLWVNGG